MSDLIKKLDNIIDTTNKIEELENSILEDQNDIKNLIMQRLLEREAICRSLNPNYGLYGDPTPSASDYFNILDVKVLNNYSIGFNWTDDWAYGGHDEGYMEFTKEEFVYGDFSKLKQNYKNN